MLDCYTGPSTEKARRSESNLDGGEPGPDYVSYLLRMWHEGGEKGSSDEGHSPAWRASVVSTLTGKRRGFASLKDLCDFLRRHERATPGQHLNHEQDRRK